MLQVSGVASFTVSIIQEELDLYFFSTVTPRRVCKTSSINEIKGGEVARVFYFAQSE